MLHILKKSCGKCNGRKGIAAARLHTDRNLFAKLVMDGGNLRLRGRNRDGRVGIDRLDLAVHALHHRFQRAVFLMENLDKLFGADIVG